MRKTILAILLVIAFSTNCFAFWTKGTDTAPEVQTFCKRVLDDGGTVVDVEYMDKLVKLLKQLGIWGNVNFLGDANFAVKKDAANAVATLYDLKGSNDAVQTTGANQPIWTASSQNGKYGIGYSGATSFMTVGTESNFDFERTDSFSVYSILKIPAAGGGYLTSKLTQGGSYEGWEVVYGATTYLYLINTLTSNQMYCKLDPPGFDDSVTRSFLMTYNGTSAYAGIIFYSNNVVQSHDGETGALTATILNAKNVYIGARDGGVNFTGTIMTNIIFDIVPTATQRTAIETFINQYYQIY